MRRRPLTTLSRLHAQHTRSQEFEGCATLHATFANAAKKYPFNRCGCVCVCGSSSCLLRLRSLGCLLAHLAPRSDLSHSCTPLTPQHTGALATACGKRTDGSRTTFLTPSSACVWWLCDALWRGGRATLVGERTRTVELEHDQ